MAHIQRFAVDFKALVAKYLVIYNIDIQCKYYIICTYIYIINMYTVYAVVRTFFSNRLFSVEKNKQSAVVPDLEKLLQRPEEQQAIKVITKNIQPTRFVILLKDVDRCFFISTNMVLIFRSRALQAHDSHMRNSHWSHGGRLPFLASELPSPRPMNGAALEELVAAWHWPSVWLKLYLSLSRPIQKLSLDS